MVHVFIYISISTICPQLEGWKNLKQGDTPLIKKFFRSLGYKIDEKIFEHLKMVLWHSFKK